MIVSKQKTKALKESLKNQKVLQEKPLMEEDKHDNEEGVGNEDDVRSVEEENELRYQTSKDSTSSRLRVLKAALIKVIYKHHGEEIENVGFINYVGNIANAELQMCLLLFNLLMPYTPFKKNSSVIDYRLPFVLLGNDILHYSGYSDFTRNDCPLSSQHTLDSLHLDVTTIYDIYSMPKENSLYTFDFDGYVIDSEDYASSNKDATFGSFFRIKNIYSTCDQQELKFGQRITISPDLKTMHILGYKPGNFREDQ